MQKEPEHNPNLGGRGGFAEKFEVDCITFSGNLKLIG